MDLLTSIVRTAVPYIIGLVVTLLATWGFNLSDDLKSTLDSLLTFIIGTLYYIIVRKIEAKYPKAGFLLGIPTQPTYTK